jgi:hypothetical protein
VAVERRLKVSKDRVWGCKNDWKLRERGYLGGVHCISSPQILSFLLNWVGRFFRTKQRASYRDFQKYYQKRDRIWNLSLIELGFVNLLTFHRFNRGSLSL